LQKNNSDIYGVKGDGDNMGEGSRRKERLFFEEEEGNT
jgi:hypothetical protein